MANLQQDVEVLQIPFEADRVYWSRIVATNPGSNPLQPYTQVELEYLSDATQSLPFVIGSRDTAALHGMTHRQALMSVGYEASWLDEKIANGLVFHLVVFENDNAAAATGVPPVQATWDGLMQLMGATSPASIVCAGKLAPIWEAIQAVPCVRGGPIEDINQLSEELIPVVTSFEGLAAYPMPVTPELGRTFLRHTMRCTPLYRGDGYSWPEDGQRGGEEFLIPRVLIERLEPTAVVQLCWERS